MKRIALYARVSTAEQHPEAQLNALREYARARGLEVAQEYVDHGVSGTRDRRPALDALLTAMPSAAGSIDLARNNWSRSKVAKARISGV
jgi:DNA invertase Pin-like site-specific DNA recombinase